jgi:hypothetical protein
MMPAKDFDQLSRAQRRSLHVKIIQQALDAMILL